MTSSLAIRRTSSRLPSIAGAQPWPQGQRAAPVHRERAQSGNRSPAMNRPYPLLLIRTSSRFRHKLPPTIPDAAIDSRPPAATPAFTATGISDVGGHFPPLRGTRTHPAGN